MKLPGEAWLQYEIMPIDENQCNLIKSAFFEPKGLAGLAYWSLLYPIHKIIFNGLIKILVFHEL